MWDAQCHSRDPQPVDLLPVLGGEDLDPMFAERFEWEDRHSFRDIWEWGESDEGRVGWVDDVGGGESGGG